MLNEGLNFYSYIQATPAVFSHSLFGSRAEQARIFFLIWILVVKHQNAEVKPIFQVYKRNHSFYCSCYLLEFSKYCTYTITSAVKLDEHSHTKTEYCILQLQSESGILSPSLNDVLYSTFAEIKDDDDCFDVFLSSCSRDERPFFHGMALNRQRILPTWYDLYTCKNCRESLN